MRSIQFNASLNHTDKKMHECHINHCFPANTIEIPAINVTIKWIVEMILTLKPDDNLLKQNQLNLQEIIRAFDYVSLWAKSIVFGRYCLRWHILSWVWEMQAFFSVLYVIRFKFGERHWIHYVTSLDFRNVLLWTWCLCVSSLLIILFCFSGMYLILRNLSNYKRENCVSFISAFFGAFPSTVERFLYCFGRFLFYTQCIVNARTSATWNRM